MRAEDFINVHEERHRDLVSAAWLASVAEGALRPTLENTIDLQTASTTSMGCWDCLPQIIFRMKLPWRSAFPCCSATCNRLQLETAGGSTGNDGLRRADEHEQSWYVEVVLRYTFAVCL